MEKILKETSKKMMEKISEPGVMECITDEQLREIMSKQMSLSESATEQNDSEKKSIENKDVLAGNGENEINKTNNPIEDFEETIKKYVSENEIHLFILTPCYGGVCHVDYSLSLIQTIMIMSKFDIKTTIEVCRGDSLVTRARNGLIAKAMTKGATHLFFIDSDIIWKPIDVLKLLISDEKLSGGIYPKKKYNWDIFDDKDVLKKYEENMEKSIFKETLNKSDFPQCKLVNYNFITESKTINIVSNLMELKHLPTGFMMIKRCVIEEMMEKYPETKYTDDSDFLSDNEQKYAYALFDCAIRDEQYLSEDWLFCDRYRKLGNKIYANVTIDLIHVGVNYFKGKTTSIFV
jgi:hypothetical protein